MNEEVFETVKGNDLDDSNVEELAKFFDLLQKFDVQDKKMEAEKGDPVKV